MDNNTTEFTRMHDLRTHVLFLNGAGLAVVGIRHSGSATDDAPALVGSVVALVTDPHQGAWPHVGVADHTLSIVFFTQASNGCRMRWRESSNYWIVWDFQRVLFENSPTPGCLRQKIKSG